MSTAQVSAANGLTAEIDVARGGAVTSITLPCAKQILSTVPDDLRRRVVVDAPPGDRAHHSKVGWIAASKGGWEIMAPNAGDAGRIDDLWFDFHGTAGRVPWRITTAGPDRIQIETDCPLTSHERVVQVGDTACTITERITSTSSQVQPFAWGSHLAFGQDLTSEDVRIELPGAVVGGDLDGVIVPPDALAEWVKRPLTGHSALAFVDTQGRGRARLTNRSGLAATVEWDAHVFSYAWVWVELGGTTGWPWYGELRAIGIEPVSVWPASGVPALFSARRAPELRPGETVASEVRLSLEWPAADCFQQESSGAAGRTARSTPGTTPEARTARARDGV